jgi:hypothetical protein
MRYCPQTHVFNTWSPAGGAIIRGSGNLRRGVLAGGNMSLGACPWVLYLVLGFLLPVCPPPHAPAANVLPKCMGLNDHELKSEKL